MTEVQPIRLVYFGTPDYAIPTLESLAGDPRYKVVLAVTQPDRPAGRGQSLLASPVKRTATRLGLPVYQPVTLRDPSSRLPLESAGADLFVVAAYGLIFGRRTLSIPRYGSLNLHASVLPAYRGASPVTAAILAGDPETGVTLMAMDVGLDTGPMIATVRLSISDQDTTETLTHRLGVAGADLAVSAIPRSIRGDLMPVPQPDAAATVVRPLVKSDGWLDWGDGAEALERRIRAMWPWPRAWTTFRGQPLQIHQAQVVTGIPVSPPGTIHLLDRNVVVACGSDGLQLDVMQPAGGRPITGPQWASGRRLSRDERLGLEGQPPPTPPLIRPA